MDAGALLSLSFFFSPGPQPVGWCCPHSFWVFPLNHPNLPQTHPGVWYCRDSNFHQADKMNHHTPVLSSDGRKEAEEDHSVWSWELQRGCCGFRNVTRASGFLPVPTLCLPGAAQGHVPSEGGMALDWDRFLDTVGPLLAFVIASVCLGRRCWPVQ